MIIPQVNDKNIIIFLSIVFLSISLFFNFLFINTNKEILTLNFNDEIDLKINNIIMEKAILSISQEFQLSPYYVVSHFDTESKLNPRAKGKDGDYGLGQLLIPTAIGIANRKGLTNLAKDIKRDPSILYDIYINTYLSCCLMREILDSEKTLDIIDFQGQYNRGKKIWLMKNNYPTRMKKCYKKRYGNIDINIVFKLMKNRGGFLWKN